MEVGNKSKTPLQILFGTKPKRAAIAEAAGNLFSVNGCELGDIRLLQLWADILEPFDPEQLAMGFAVALATEVRYPKPAHVAEPILAAEFQEDLAWLLKHLAIHGTEWRDRAAHYGPEIRRLYGALAVGDAVYLPGPLIAEAIAAPPMPARLKTALKVYGAGERRRGLERLQDYLGHDGQDKGDLARIRGAFERDFRAAWRMARAKEMTA